MKTLFFNTNDLRNKLITQLWYWVVLKHFVKVLNFEIFYWDFFFTNIKFKLFFFVIWYQSLILKFMVNKLPNIEILKKKELIIKKKYIQKGIKLNNLGIYIKDLRKSINLSNNDIFYKKKLNYDNEILKNFLNKNSYYYYLIRFKRKNLFLTLLNDKGDVVCKINVGSCGFKKKLKSTSHAIKKTTEKFTKRIQIALIKNISQILEIKKKKKKKKMYINDYIEDLNVVSKLFFKRKKRKKIIKLKKKNLNLKKKKCRWMHKKTFLIYIPLKGNRRKRRKLRFSIWKLKKRYNRRFRERILNDHLKFNRKWWKYINTNTEKLKNLVRKKRKKKVLMDLRKNPKKKIMSIKIKKKEELYEDLLIKKNIKKFIYYRDYLYFKDLLKRKLKIICRIKSNVKFWGNRFVIYGMKRNLNYWLRAFEIRSPIPHSTGLRLKKARRL